MALLPGEYSNVILFNTLTGLRPDESLKTIDLIKIYRIDGYVDNKKMLLCHYKFLIYS